ncbi:recombinase family protein [Aestuariivirga sp.]|uniref:recombinase family protein n=1 Tax=Aestuariivirga sp. TaxID=2650926 RepID=UPI0039E4097D
MTKAYSYLRFSTPEQIKGDSHRRQAQMANDYADRHGLELQDASYEDLGVSAYRSANAETGRLGEFMEAVKIGAVPQGSWLLIESMDRLSRAKPRKAVRLLEQICEAGIVVVTLADGRVYDERTLDDDPMAFMYAFMVAIRANEESATKARRLRAVWQQKRINAPKRILTKRAPSWLRVMGDGPERRFEVIEEKAAIVRRVFAMAAGGIGQHKIAETLNREGLPTADGAKHWHKSIIAKWLRSPSVIGTYVPHTIDPTAKHKLRHPESPVDNYYPAIVSRELYEAVNALHGGERKSRSVHDGRRGVVSLLAGLARCASCGGTMTRVNKASPKKGGRAYLVCAAAKVGAGCEYRAVDQEAIEKALRGLSSTIRAKASKTIAIDEDLKQQAAKLRAQVDEATLHLSRVTDEMLRQPSPQIRAEFDNQAAVKEHSEHRLIEINRQLASGGASIVMGNAGAAADALEAEPLDIAKANAGLRRAFDKAVISWRMGQVELHWRHTGDWGLKASFDMAARRRAPTKAKAPLPSSSTTESAEPVA